MRKTMHEIIDEIANHYNLNNRSIIEGTGVCRYNGPDEKLCAFAYMVKDEMKPSLEEGNNCDQIMKEWLVKYHADDYGLKDEYKGYFSGFYRDIQVLHDEKIHWTEDGLSCWGACFVKELKEKWS